MKAVMSESSSVPRRDALTSAAMAITDSAVSSTAALSGVEVFSQNRTVFSPALDVVSVWYACILSAL